MTTRRFDFFPEVWIWLALVLLLGLTFGLAYVPLGMGNGPVGLCIAAIKAAIVALFFMHVPRESVLIRIASTVGLSWLIVFFILTFSDYLTRRN